MKKVLIIAGSLRKASLTRQLGKRIEAELSKSAEVGWRFNFDQCNMVSLSLYGSYALNRCSPDVAASEIVDVENGVARRLSPMQAGLVDGYRYYTAGFCIAYHLGVGSPLLK